MNFNPAENLDKISPLDGGWRVLNKVATGSGKTGANFSVGYIIANSSGRRGFLKAFDWFQALQTQSSTNLLQELLAAFNYEKDILAACGENNLDRVVVAIGDGYIPVRTLHPILPVPYLIFDLAEDGDVRGKLKISNQFELAFCLRSLHHCAVGLSQLHSIQIAHQDLKPSNVLVYAGDNCKIADLGSSSVLGSQSPRDIYDIAGDHSYAPPELQYSQISSDWRTRRFACDLYHLGSLGVFFFAKISVGALWQRQIDPSHLPRRWGHSYKDVLPYVRDAHEWAFQQFETCVPNGIRSRLVSAIRQLCDPDPLLRGHPKNRGPRGNPYSLERYIATFDLLASRAELQMRRMLV